MVRPLPVILAVVTLLTMATEARAQRFGGQFGAAGGVWLLYVAPDVESDRAFGRELGDILAIGGRGFLQLGRVRLGGGGFGGSFTDEGLNPDGNDISGGLSGGGFTAEYLLVQKEWEIGVGGFLGGGNLTIEERLGVEGDVENLNRRQRTIFIGIPSVRAAYNLAPFVNAGLQVGYLAGSEGVDGFTLGLDVVVGLIP